MTSRCRCVTTPLSWQMMNGGGGIWAEVAGYNGTGRWSVTSQADCAATVRDACRADSKQQTGAFNYVPPNNKSNAWSGQTLAFKDFDEHLAAFLLMRGPHAWFGYGTYNRSDSRQHTVSVFRHYNQCHDTSLCHCSVAALMLVCIAWWSAAGWVGCSQNYTRPAQLDADYGTPQGLCSETSPGVFERSWTKAHVKLDCKGWHGSVTPKLAA
eukprot:SAG22_NODE_6058_length_908_cov_1.138443_1_plen_211_part_00